MAGAGQENPFFDPVTATISDVHAVLKIRRRSVKDIVDRYLSRIVALDPTINAMICLNPLVLEQARDLDYELSNCDDVPELIKTKPLFAVPTILKDNFDCPPMATTAGCLALKDCYPTTEAPTVRALKQAGAIILGKVNMHELALEGLTVSSLGGQTLNPWDLTRTPGGSSGGSGAALAAGFCLLATGTDTINSLRSPASANGVVSCRPSRGLISRSGVVPFSYTQDAVGMMGRCVKDVAQGLGIIASVGPDPQDDVTLTQSLRKDYVALLETGNLTGARLGLVEGFLPKELCPETSPVSEAVVKLCHQLQQAGAEVISISSEMYDSQKILVDLAVHGFEYRDQLTKHLQRPEMEGQYPKSMPNLYQTPHFMVIPAQYGMVKHAVEGSLSRDEYEKRLQGIEELKMSLTKTLSEHRLDALLYPEQVNLVVKTGSQNQYGRNGILGALTGSPVVAFPVASSSPNADAPRGVPIGFELLGRPYAEPRLLQIAAHVERLLGSNEHPFLAEQPVTNCHFQSVPRLSLNRCVPSAYPVGTLSS
ncbi:MAG: hypothetical protein Q9162_005413 [Coniocarpon cinnabarinum]